MEDGTARIPATVTIYLGRGTWTVCLNERQLKLVTFADSNTLVGAFEAMEAKLAGPEPGWKEWRGTTKGGKK
jgi:hypothetical protein